MSLCDAKWTLASTVSLLVFTRLKVCSGSYEPECLQLKVDSESRITVEIAGILSCCNSLLGFQVISSVFSCRFMLDFQVILLLFIWLKLMQIKSERRGNLFSVYKSICRSHVWNYWCRKLNDRDRTFLALREVSWGRGCCCCPLICSGSYEPESSSFLQRLFTAEDARLDGSESTIALVIAGTRTAGGCILGL